MPASSLAITRISKQDYPEITPVVSRRTMKPTRGAPKGVEACSRPRKVNPIPATGTRRAAGGTMRSICGPKAPSTTEMTPLIKFAASATLYAFKKLCECRRHRIFPHRRKVHVPKREEPEGGKRHRMYAGGFNALLHKCGSRQLLVIFI